MKNIIVKYTNTGESAVAQTMVEALRDTDLTTDEAEELRERLQKPRIAPARQLCELPTMDPSRLRP